MNKKTEESALKEGGTVEVSNEAQAKQEIAGAGTK
jgi:chemotaxis protein MotB